MQPSVVSDSPPPPRPGAHEIGLIPFLLRNWLNLLLIFVPISIIAEFLHAPELWLFGLSAVAIIPLAGLIGEATEQIAHRVGPGIGGLLNATFGNATELIIALFALRAGLHEVVKASISGSIIGNILLVLGLSMFLGGLGRDKQRFSRTHAGASAAMLLLAVVGLVMPAVFDLAVYGNLEEGHPLLANLSLLVAIVLMLTYLASLVFSLRTHHALIGPPGEGEAQSTDDEEEDKPDVVTSGEASQMASDGMSEGERQAGLRRMIPPRSPAAAPPGHSGDAILSKRSALILLFIATIVTAFESEVLVGAISEATHVLGMTEFFVGVIVVAIVGNAAEHFSAVTVAMKNQMDLSITIAIGSSTQIALFVAPVLVFASFLFGQPMSLVFNAFEIVAITLSVLILSIVSLDGESNWFEGLQLVAVYIILGIVFFFVPVGT